MKGPATRTKGRSRTASAAPKARPRGKNNPTVKVYSGGVKNAWVEQVTEEWDDTVPAIKAQLTLRQNQPGAPPSERSEAYLKRKIYEFVCGHLDSGTGKYLDIVLETARPSSAGPTFKENPFHRALYTFYEPAPGDKKMRWKISRYGKLLSYARRHMIPPELLTGFLLQSGTEDQICKKANWPEMFEPWWPKYLARLPNSGSPPGESLITTTP